MMKTHTGKWALAAVLLIVVLVSGCSGGTGQRIPGLLPEDVVRTFYGAVQSNHLNEAALYVDPGITGDSATLAKYMAGPNGLQDIQNSNLVSIRKAAEKDNFAIVVATFQQQNTFKLTVKTVPFEKINGEWYIVDLNKAYTDAKFSMLQQLLGSI